MAIQLSVTARNDRLDALEGTVGTSPKLRILTGSAPADCATAQAGTLLCEITLPSDWMAAASSGSKAKLGTWQGTAVAGGTAGYFRIVNSGGTTAHVQGTCGIGTGDLQLDNTSIASSQTVTVTAFTLTDGNA